MPSARIAARGIVRTVLFFIFRAALAAACGRTAMNTLRGASESLFGTGVKLRIRFADAESLKTVSVKIGNKQSEQLLFGPHDAVRGVVHVDSPGGRRLEHTGIRLELIGQIESLLDRTTHEFTSLVRELVREHAIALLH
jgi:hypothetical protein